MTHYDIQSVREDFPILATEVNGHPLVYLDNGATTQKPKAVIEAISNYYTQINSNVHRGVHHLSQVATEAFEQTRRRVQSFINAEHDYEVIFTGGTTHAVNLVAQCYGKEFVRAGDVILISGMEHHSNIVPWQLLCEEKEAELKVIPVTDEGELDMEALSRLLDERVKMLALTYVSNTLGTINPIKRIIEEAHRFGVPVLVDAAQAVQHFKLDVQSLDADFVVFSGHKMYGPTGIGILYGKQYWLDQMPPYQGGGDMIKEVTFERTTYNSLPFRFEAGTPNIEAGICLLPAIDYIERLGLENIALYERELLDYLLESLGELEGIRFIGEAKERCSVVSFLIDGTHPYDVGVILDKLGIAVRTGHHCTQPLMQRYGIPGTVRASLALYNTREEVDVLIKGVRRAADMLR